MNGLKLILSLVFLLVSQSSLAFRCGHALVTQGDYKDEVLDKCGEPEYFNSHWERRGNINHADIGVPYQYGYRQQFPANNLNYGQAYYQEEQVLVEEWTYDFGRHKFSQHLRFENGRLKSVESGRKRR